jgi:cell division protein FtsB
LLEVGVLFPRVPKADAALPRKRQTPKAKRPVRSRRMVSLLLLVVAGAIIVDGLVGDRGLLAMLRARQAYEVLSATIERKRTDNARLREEARRLKDDPSAIEEVARRELGLIKPGERVFIVKDVPPPKQ